MKKLLPLLMGVVLLYGSTPPLYSKEKPVFTSLTRRGTLVSKLPTNITTITAEQIEKTGATNLTEVLDKAPSIDISQSGSLGSLASVRIRGVPTSNQVQILVDDQPLGGVSIQNIDISLIPVEDIEKIEIVRGGQSVLYGANAIGGIIHIHTKKQKEDGVSLDLGAEGRSHKTEIYKVQAGARGSKADAFVTHNQFRTDGYQQNSDARNHYYAGNVGVSFANGSRLGGEFSYTDQEQGTASGTPVPFDQWNGERELEPNTPTNRIDKSFQQGRFRFDTPLSDSMVKLVGYHSVEDYEIRSSPSADPFSTYENTILGSDARVMLPAGFTGGFSYERDERASLGQADQHITNVAGYLRDDYAWGPSTISPAVRWDHHSTYKDEVNPQLSAVMNTSENSKISAGVARTYRAPTLVDLYVVSEDPLFPAFNFYGNPNLQPEYGWSFDVGVEVELLEMMTFNMGGYYTKIQDRITTVDSDNSGIVDTMGNAGTAELSGFEFDLVAQTWFLSHSGNYTFQHARGHSAGSTDFVPLRLTPKHLANYILTAHGPWAVQLINTLQYSDKQYEFDGEQGVRLPSYWLWDIRLEKRWHGVLLFAAVHNLTNRIYADSITFGNPMPQPGRTYRAGVTVKFPFPEKG